MTAFQIFEKCYHITPQPSFLIPSQLRRTANRCLEAVRCSCTVTNHQSRGSQISWPSTLNLVLLNAGSVSNKSQIIQVFLECLQCWSTNSQGNWLHCCTALTVRTFFLIFNENLAIFNLSPLLRVLHSGMIENISCPYSV